ncbi:MAG: hypothetical protein ACYDGZ_16980 [Desulfosporosinus fructosivorans]
MLFCLRNDVALCHTASRAGFLGFWVWKLGNVLKYAPRAWEASSTAAGLAGTFHVQTAGVLGLE